MPVAQSGVGNKADHLKSPQAVRDRLLMSLPARGMIRGTLPVGDRPFRQARLAQVVGDEFGLAGNHIGVASFENLCDPRMQVLPAALEQAPIGGVAHQRVLEGVGRAGACAARGNQPG